MKITPVGDFSFQLTRYGFVNCYLVGEAGGGGKPDGFTVIDTGLPGSEEAILEAAKRFDGTIQRILLTHAHMDHIGSVDALAARLGPIEIAISERSLPFLSQPPDKSLQPEEPGGVVRGGLSGMKTKPTRLVAEGDRFGSLLAIATPGHIPGHISFLDERDGTLYAGDALITVGKLTVNGFSPWYFPLPNFATWNRDVALESARKLLRYPVQRFASGHGILRDGGVPALRDAIAAAGG